MHEFFCVVEFCMTELIVIFEISRLTQPNRQIPPVGKRTISGETLTCHIVYEYIAMARLSGFMPKTS